MIKHIVAFIVWWMGVDYELFMTMKQHCIEGSWYAFFTWCGGLDLKEKKEEKKKGNLYKLNMAMVLPVT